MKPKIIVIVAIAIIIGLMAVKLVFNKKELDSKNKPQSENQSFPVAVTTATATISTAKSSLVKTGSLLPYQEVDITAAAQGKLQVVRFELGENVKKGQVLAKVDCELKLLQLKQTELAIKKLKADVERFESLLAGDAATEIQVNEIKFNYDNTKVQAEQMKKQISDATILAPASGVIVRKNYEEGEFVNPGFNLGMIVDISRLKVQVQVTETEVYRVRSGQEVKVSSDILPGNTFSGNVNYVSPKGDDTHNYLVEITLQNDSANSLKAGSFVYVDFTSDAEVSVLQIPRSALVESIRNPYLYVVDGNIARLRTIKVGRELGENIEVLDGLKENDIVITSGQINLSDNAEVKIVE